MKTFINVLYRRILYKIPLKFLLILLAIFAVFIASFSNAANVESLADLNSISTTNVSTNWTTLLSLPDNDSYTICYNLNNGNQNLQYYVGYCDGNNCSPGGTYTIYGDYFGKYFCVIKGAGDHYFRIRNLNGVSSNVNGEYFVLQDLLTSTLPLMSSLECQSTYNLIPINSVDSDYCVNNNLCPSSDCPVCPEGGSGFSNVYINDIFHPSAFNIIMNIPAEIDRDYAYTNNGTNLNIDVVGYNVDYDYMDNVVNIQNYKPDNTDLQSIITDIIPLFVPGLVVILFLYFIFKFIKKIF